MSLASIYFQKKYGNGTPSTNNNSINPSECANLTEYLFRLRHWEGNPSDDPLEAFVRFVQCTYLGISPPASILNWIAKTFESFLKNYTSSTRPKLDELFNVSGNKQIRKKYNHERNELIALKVAIYLNSFQMPLKQACDAVFRELSERKDLLPPFLKVKVPDIDRIAQIYRKNTLKEWPQFPALGTPEFNDPTMKVYREFLAKYLKSLPEQSLRLIRGYLPPSDKFLNED